MENAYNKRTITLHRYTVCCILTITTSNSSPITIYKTVRWATGQCTFQVCIITFWGAYQAQVIVTKDILHLQSPYWHFGKYSRAVWIHKPCWRWLHYGENCPKYRRNSHDEWWLNRRRMRFDGERCGNLTFVQEKFCWIYLTQLHKDRIVWLKYQFVNRFKIFK